MRIVESWILPLLIGLFGGYLASFGSALVTSGVWEYVGASIIGVFLGAVPMLVRSNINQKRYRDRVSQLEAELKVERSEIGRLRQIPDQLTELAINYENCKWIQLPAAPEAVQQEISKARVDRKTMIVSQIESFLRGHKVDKTALLSAEREGYYVVLGAAIRAEPTSNDWRLVLGIDGSRLTKGGAHHQMIDVIQRLLESSLALQLSFSIWSPICVLNSMIFGMGDGRASGGCSGVA